jgi:hypothetical protein
MSFPRDLLRPILHLLNALRQIVKHLILTHHTYL